MTDELKLKISLLPETPGVYRYYNSKGVIIYVGKAKNLKRRVSSYFNKVHISVRTNILVRNIHDLEYTVVNTEEEALDLENNLIKEFQPRYNVLLKDDKSYPWICVTKELYPRVFMTRDALRKGAKYYGPYPKAETAHVLLETIDRIYPLRNCNHIVSRETIEQKKHGLCLQFHIKRCEGCCRGLVDPEVYNGYIDNVKAILNGDTKQVSDYLMGEMQRLAGELRFEEANELKRKYLAVEKLRSRSVIVTPTIHNIDVFAIKRDSDSTAAIHYMHMRNGSVVQSFTLEYRVKDVESSDAELMSLGIQEIRSRFAETYRSDRVTELIVNVLPDVDFEGLNCVIPQRGDKRKLLEIALKNAEQFLTDKVNRMEKLNPEQRVTRTLTTMQRDLHLTCLPRHIECFDNSNISGSSPVASCVVFRNAKPSKKEYRHFNIKTVVGADDYASMVEVITRRYTRMLEEGGALPQLLVVDGGKGQLSTAIEALDSIGVRNQVAAIGIAKQLNEIYFPGDSVPFYIDKNSETLRVIQRLRDEAHRFAITHHRKQRAKRQTHSVLDEIKGVGPSTRQALLSHFKSVKRIREASIDQLESVIGASKARLIHDALAAKQ